MTFGTTVVEAWLHLWFYSVVYLNLFLISFSKCCKCDTATRWSLLAEAYNTTDTLYWPVYTALYRRKCKYPLAPLWESQNSQMFICLPMSFDMEWLVWRSPAHRAFIRTSLTARELPSLWGVVLHVPFLDIHKTSVIRKLDKYSSWINAYFCSLFSIFK